MTIWPILLSSICTGVGALPILLIRNLSHQGKDVLLACTAGIMVAASAYGLIPSALKLSSLTALIIGMLVGTLVLTLLESLIPHADLDHSGSGAGPSGVFLFMVAMAIHNIPEGLSVGISMAGDPEGVGLLVSFAIGLQNLPDGFLIALFLISQNVGRAKAIFFAAVTGLIEMGAAMSGVVFGEAFSAVIPYGLAFAAGSILYIVYKELIPESHGDGNERAATIAFIFGFVIMVCLTEICR